MSHLEYAWEDPWLARLYERLASFSQLVLLDKRGTGLSDRPGDQALQSTGEHALHRHRRLHGARGRAWG